MPRRPITVLVALLAALTACESTGNSAESDALARFAGAWTVTVRDTAGNTLPGHTINATATRTGWTMVFPDRAPIAVRVLEASGDVVTFESAPYESVLRPGVQVTALFITRFSANGSAGHMRATYAGGTEPIPVLRATTAGTR